MRIITVLISLFFSLFAEPAVYIGLSVENSTEFFSYDGHDTKASTPLYKFKAGYGDIDSYAVEASVSYMDYASNVFSGNDGAAYMVDITLCRGWDTGYDLYPYLGVGFGMGDMKVDRILEESLSFSSFNFGGGVRYLVSDDIDIDLGLNYKVRSWQSISLVSEDVKITSHLINPYIGVNFHF